MRLKFLKKNSKICKSNGRERRQKNILKNLQNFFL